jgi:hypothetical protein
VKLAAVPHDAWGCGALLAALAMPAVRHALEASMTAQMLVQIPLLAAAGVLAARLLPGRVIAAIGPWNRGGASALVLATFASVFWMLPRSLDASVGEPLLAAAKYASVPLAIGLPLGLAWPRMGFVLKGVFLLESIATLLRLGWLYRVSPERLCNNYLLHDQQRLGSLLLAAGGALAFAIGWKLFCGRFRPSPGARWPGPA